MLLPFLAPSCTKCWRQRVQGSDLSVPKDRLLVWDPKALWNKLVLKHWIGIKLHEKNLPVWGSKAAISAANIDLQPIIRFFLSMELPWLEFEGHFLAHKVQHNWCVRLPGLEQSAIILSRKHWMKLVVVLFSSLSLFHWTYVCFSLSSFPFLLSSLFFLSILEIFFSRADRFCSFFSLLTPQYGT